MEHLWVDDEFEYIVLQDIRVLKFYWKQYPYVLNIERWDREFKELLSVQTHIIYTVYDLESLERQYSKKYKFEINSRLRWLPYFQKKLIKTRRYSINILPPPTPHIKKKRSNTTI